MNNDEMVPQPQLSPEQAQQMLERRLQSFTKNGIPLQRVAPVVPSGNPAILNKIQQIKMGLKKNEFSDIIYKEVADPMAPLPAIPLNKKSQQKRPGIPQKPGGPPPPELFSASAVLPSNPNELNELMEAERLLGGDSTPVSRQPSYNPQAGPIGVGNRMPAMQQASDEEGMYAAQEVKTKFYSNIQEKQARMQQAPVYAPEQIPGQQYYQSPGVNPQQQYVPYPYQAPMLPAGAIMINEEDLKKKIINISSQVAKKISEQMIKTVLSEYLKQSKNTIVESDKIKKAEVVGENVVKIDGKVFKLVPATLKVKEE